MLIFIVTNYSHIQLRYRAHIQVLTPLTIRRHIPMHMRPVHRRILFRTCQNTLDTLLHTVQESRVIGSRVIPHIRVHFHIIITRQDGEGKERHGEEFHAPLPERLLCKLVHDLTSGILSYRLAAIKDILVMKLFLLGVCKFNRRETEVTIMP